eukprot:8961239-Pyramimonas_sp.AAC.1
MTKAENAESVFRQALATADVSKQVRRAASLMRVASVGCAGGRPLASGNLPRASSGRAVPECLEPSAFTH